MALDHRRIAHQSPWQDRGPDVTVLPERVRVVVVSRWHDGYVAEVEGWAVAYTPRAVEVGIPHPDDGEGAYRIWVPTADVRRSRL